MKKKNLLSLAVVGLIAFILPLTVKAKEVTIYFFKGETCSYCASAATFFESLESDSEYEGKFVIREYEVWNNASNAEIMEEVADKRGDTLSGVPYYVIGDKSWNGYSSSMNEEIKAQILKIYNDDSYEDDLIEIVGEAKEKEDTTMITIAIIAGVVVIAGLALFVARRNSDEEEYEEIVETKKEEPKKEEKVTEEKVEVKEAPKKTTTAKKTSTKKKTTSKKKSTSKKSTAKKTK